MYCVYLLYNKLNQLIYVGKSSAIDTRIRSHKSSKRWRDHKISKILVAACNSKTDMEIYELYYINKLKPLANMSHVNNDMPSYAAKELEFTEYIPQENAQNNNRVRNKKYYFSTAFKEKRIDEEGIYRVLINNKENILNIFYDENGYLSVLFNDEGKARIKEVLLGCREISFNDGNRSVFSCAKYYADKCVLRFDDKIYEGKKTRVDMINRLYKVLELDSYKLQKLERICELDQ